MDIWQVELISSELRGFFVQKAYEILPHTSDLKIRFYGDDLKLLFANSIKGMFEAIGPVFNNSIIIEREIEVHSHDAESLLVDCLSEALYLSDAYGEAYTNFIVKEVSRTSVKGMLRGMKIKSFKGGEIKAVTHHDIMVTDRDGFWIAEVLFDL